MKTLKISLLALLITAGVGGAVVQKIQAAPKPFEATYNWNRVGGSPITGEVDPLPDATIAEAKTNYGCAGSVTPCAHGENTQSGQPDADIFLN